MAVKRKRGYQRPFNGKRRKYVPQRRYKRKGGMASMIKRLAIRTSETKHTNWVSTASVRHNRFAIYNLMAFSLAGDTQNSIIGEEIYISGFRIRMEISNFGLTVANTNQSQFVFALIRTRDELATASLGDQDPALFQIVSTAPNNNLMLDRWNTDSIKVMKIWKQRMTPQYSSQNINKYFSTYCRINRRFKFKTALSPTAPTTAVYGKFYNYYFIVGAYVPGGSVTTTLYPTIANITAYYKDP